jgi:antitoxin HicB
MLGYRKLAPDDNGTVLVTCPALPEVTTFGEDEADALRRAVGAIEEALAARMADGDDIPEGHQRGSTDSRFQRSRRLSSARVLPVSRSCR